MNELNLDQLISTELSVDEINKIMVQLREKKKVAKRNDPEFKEKMKMYQKRRKAYQQLLWEKARAAGIRVTEEEIDEYLASNPY